MCTQRLGRLLLSGLGMMLRMNGLLRLWSNSSHMMHMRHQVLGNQIAAYKSVNYESLSFSGP